MSGTRLFQRWMSTEPVCAPPVDDGLLAVQQRQLATSLNGEITAPLGVEQPLAARTLAQRRPRPSADVAPGRDGAARVASALCQMAASRTSSVRSICRKP